MACQERQTGLRHRYRLRQTKSQGAGELVDMGQTSRKKRRTQKVLGKLERVGEWGIFNGSWGDRQASKAEMGRQRELVRQVGW